MKMKMKMRQVSQALQGNPEASAAIGEDVQAHLSTASAMEVQLYFQLRFPFAAYMRDAEANRAGYGPPPRLARRYLGNLLAEGAELN